MAADVGDDMGEDDRGKKWGRFMVFPAFLLIKGGFGWRGCDDSR